MQETQFDPWAEKIPHALEQLGPQPLGLCSRARELQPLKPVCPETRAPWNPCPTTREASAARGLRTATRGWPPHAATGDSPYCTEDPAEPPRKNCDRGLSFLLLGCWQDSDSCSKRSLLRCIQFVKTELYTCVMWTYLYVYYASVFYQKNLSFSVFPLPQGNFCNQFLVSFLSYFEHIKAYIFFFPYKYCMNHTSLYFFSPFHFICLVNCSISAFFFLIDLGASS